MYTFQIKLFPRVAVYSTGWAGELTFEQLHDELALYASNVMRRNGFRLHEIPDGLQNGFMALWQTLSAQPDFLTKKTRRQAVFFILARSKVSTMRYQEDKYDRLEDLISDDWHNTADEHIIDGMQHQRGERWAGWATVIDMRIDIERVMHKLATKYADSLKHLVALYHVTTQVSRVDAANIAGVTPWNWYKTYVLPVLAEVRYEFAQVFLESHCYALPELPAEQPNKNARTGRFTSPYREWREQYRQGNTTPAGVLLNRYSHTLCLIQALHAQIDGKTYQQAAEHYGRKLNSFKKHMKRAAKLLKSAYAA
jgi:DNA-directed RNA polymerase specialized sigma24 family protein